MTIRDLMILLVHAAATLMRLVRPGGVRAVVAESVLAKHQLLILNRSRRRAPNLRILDRVIAGFCSLWIQPGRLPRVAIAFKPSTLLGFHRAMVQRKYRLLFSPKQKAKPGPKGPTAHLIRSVVEMKQRNPTLGISSHRRPTSLSEPLFLRMLNRIQERIHMGLQRARTQGKQLGRRRVIADREKVRELHQAGESLRAIAEVLGLTKSTVFNIVTAN
jgi:hypothetical protein